MTYEAAQDRYDSTDYRRTGGSGLTLPPLTDDELAEIDRYAPDSGVDLWARQTEE